MQITTKVVGKWTCALALMWAVMSALPAAAAKFDAHSALIVVDMQNCFVEGGTLPVKGGSAIVPVINQLIGEFDNVVLTQDWHPPKHASFASAYSDKKPFDSTELSYGTQVLWPDHCVQGSKDAELVSGLDAAKAQLIIRKGFHQNIDSYSAFFEADHQTPTGLQNYLKERGITKLYVVGLATDFCVAWTAMDGAKSGFEVAVIEDASKGIDLNGSLTSAWQAMKNAGVKRLQSGDIL